ncbi:MAG: alpha/beta fold hydrolase [Deltaproteobacteria bacterium]
MANFVLVHGSSGGGWYWQRLEPLLVAAGHRVYRPTLTGTGERSHLLSTRVELSTHITDIANVLFYEDITEAVLVGHSYGGMVITGVAQAVPERVSRLIYFDAYLPEPGESRWDLLPEEVVAAERAHSDADGGTGPKPPTRLFIPDDEQLAAWTDERLSPRHPVGSYSQRLPSEDAALRSISGAFIECTVGPSRFASSVERARAKGWPIRQIAARHFAMLTHPREVADVLTELAGNL